MDQLTDQSRAKVYGVRHSPFSHELVKGDISLMELREEAFEEDPEVAEKDRHADVLKR